MPWLKEVTLLLLEENDVGLAVIEQGLKDLIQPVVHYIKDRDQW